MTSHRRLLLLLAGVFACLAVAISLLAPQPAGAWGERQAVRGCGTNWITSYPISRGGRAVTQKLRGNCSGNLYAGVRNSAGGARWGPAHRTYAIASFAGSYVGGTHRGCYECGSSLT